MNLPARIGVLMLVGASLAGCGAIGSLAQGPADDLGTWRAIPLPPDAQLAAKAIASGGSCRLDTDPSDGIEAPQPTILVQDRRTSDTAAFLVVDDVHFGDCQVTRGSGGASGGFGPLLDAIDGPLSIDVSASGTVGAADAHRLGGRLAIAAARVVVQLDNGTNVTASVADGYWLTWWPGTPVARRVVALDASDTELASLAVTKP